jgi:hypothetical protein
MADLKKRLAEAEAAQRAAGDEEFAFFEVIFVR